MRFCVDYRLLNKVTKPISYGIPVLQDVVDRLSEFHAKYYSLADLKSGFNQMPLHHASRKKAAFCTHLGTFCYTTLCFGIRNASSSFQMLMQ